MDWWAGRGCSEHCFSLLVLYLPTEKSGGWSMVGLQKLARSFPSAAAYVSSFQPLLMEETRSALAQSAESAQRDLGVQLIPVSAWLRNARVYSRLKLLYVPCATLAPIGSDSMATVAMLLLLGASFATPGWARSRRWWWWSRRDRGWAWRGWWGRGWARPASP